MNALGYLRVMFAVDDLDDTLARLRRHGAQLVDEVVQYEDVYIYPLPDSDNGARARSWVRASHAQLDAPLWRVVSEWLASDWPFGSVEYTPRS